MQFISACATASGVPSEYLKKVLLTNTCTEFQNYLALVSQKGEGAGDGGKESEHIRHSQATIQHCSRYSLVPKRHEN